MTSTILILSRQIKIDIITLYSADAYFLKGYFDNMVDYKSKDAREMLYASFLTEEV